MSKVKLHWGACWPGYVLCAIGVALLAITLIWDEYRVTTATELEQWTPDLAEKQYEGAKHGRWGERIISLEGSPCELHRVRYRKIYYIANTCGGLVIEPTRIK